MRPLALNVGEEVAPHLSRCGDTCDRGITHRLSCAQRQHALDFSRTMLVHYAAGGERMLESEEEIARGQRRALYRAGQTHLGGGRVHQRDAGDGHVLFARRDGQYLPDVMRILAHHYRPVHLEPSCGITQPVVD